MEKKQSSIEWLIENYKQLHFDFQEGKINRSQFIPKKTDIEEQAKAMHKEEVENACNQEEFKDIDGYGIHETISKGKQYYTMPQRNI